MKKQIEKWRINVGTDPKTMQHIFFVDNKSIQTAAASSILPALFASELSAEIQFKTPDLAQLRRSQTNHKIWKKCVLVFIEEVCVAL